MANSSKVKNTAGFTIMELLLVIAISAILMSITVLNLNVADKKAKAEDNKRLSDLILIDRMIVEYRADYNTYPSTNLTLRSSIVLPAGSTDLSSATLGWIAQDLHRYSSRLPIDPVNNETYHYEYIRSDDTYELNAVLRITPDLMSSDGGNDPLRYEIGNNLSLISP